jgi:hypothetical protein
MKSSPPHRKRPGLACALAVVLLLASSSSAAKAASPKAAVPRPAPVTPASPVRNDVLFAAGFDAPWWLPRYAWISSDGKNVAFFTREASDDESISRTLVVKDVDTDAVVFEKLFFSTGESEESLQRGIRELVHLARTRTWETLPYMDQHQWMPLTRHELPESETEFLSDYCFMSQMRPKRSVSAGDLKISYQEPRVQIARRGRKVLDRRFPDWRVRQELCEHPNPSWLKSVFVSREHGVVLLELGFCGMDLCSEPAEVFHALRIPKDKPRGAGNPPVQAGAQARVPLIGYKTEGAARKSLYATGLPAVSQDGTSVALAEAFANEHGDPNLLLTVRRPRTQELVWSFPVLAPGEVSATRGSPPREQELEGKLLERIRQANEHLGKTPWVPLAEQPIHPLVTEHCQQAPLQKLRLPELELTFNQGHLVIVKQGEDAPFVDLKLAREGAREEEPCQASSRLFLDAAYADVARGVILLRLTECGDEVCEERDGWYHAVPLR